MAIVKWKNRDLYDPWADLQDEINDLFSIDRFPEGRGLFDHSVSPAINIIEGEHDFTVTCELPGLEEKDIDVSIASNVLTIKGEKHDENEIKNDRYYKKESWSGSFQRTLPLPSSVNNEKIGAELKNGLLTIKLPKTEEAKTKQITVNVK